MKRKFVEAKTFLCYLFCTILLTVPSESVGQDILYGMTQHGGMYNKGVPYQINTDGTNFFSFEDFDGSEGEHPTDGARFIQLYNTARIKAFRLSVEQTLTALIATNTGYGNRIQIKAGLSGVSSLSSSDFRASVTGTNPTGGFLASPNGGLYGLMSSNGQNGGGTLFNIADVLSPRVTVLAGFDGPTKGRSPKGTPVYGTNCNMYGTTEFGGVYDLGVVFSFNGMAYNPRLVKLVDFDGVNRGANPSGSLLLASNGRLYGMTKNGGIYGHGVIFSVLHDGSDFTKLVDLNGPVTGSNPKGSLTQFTDGNLYGMTTSGGVYGFGTIFRVTQTGTFSKILDFDGNNGKAPVGDLLVDISGKVMYGTTYSGGSNDQGVLFKLENGSQFTKLYDYNVISGSNPVGILTMMKKQPVVTIESISNKTILSASFTPLTTAEVDLPVYFASRDTSVVGVEKNRLVFKKPGNSIIYAIQLGNHEYLGAIDATSITVEKATQSITFNELPAKTFGDAPFTINATSSSGLPVSFASSNSAVATVEGNKVTIVRGGHVTITAYQNGDSNYEQAKSVPQHLFVEKAEQTITFNPPSVRLCCDYFTLVATSSAKLPVLFKSTDHSKLTISETLATPLGVGKVEIIAYHAGNDNYKPAEKRVLVEILKGGQTIYFSNNIAPPKVGDPPVYLATGSSRNLPVTFTSDPPGIAVIDKGFLHFLAEGTTTITATQAGNHQYYAAAPVSVKFTVGAPSTAGVGNTISFPDFGEKTIVDPPFNLTARATSALPVSYVSSNPAVAEISGNLVIIKSIGKTLITATQPGTPTIVAATPVAKEIEIKKASQSISLASIPSSIPFSTLPIPLPTRTTSGLPITYTLSDPALASIENYYLTIKRDGILTITASEPGNNLYMPAQTVTKSVSITPINDNVYFKNVPQLTFGDNPIVLEAWASSGLPITFSSSDSNIASIEGLTLTVKAAGNVTLVASSINPGYRISRSEQKIIISKKRQAIEFLALAPKKFGDLPFKVSAISTVGLPVSFESMTPDVIRVNGQLVTIIGNGIAKLAALQPGDGNYEPAESVVQEFLVTDAGNVYEIIGAASDGGPNQSGVVFSMDSEGKSFGYLKHFDARTAPHPYSGFVRGADGKLYGNFRDGGTGGGGSVVRMEADGTGFTYLRHFSSPDGIRPVGNLIQATDGHFYGTTNSGGALGGGTIFRIKPDGTDFKVVYNLGALTGGLPSGGVIQASDGKLYGITPSGGFYSRGTIFSVNTDGSGFTILFHLRDAAPLYSGVVPRGHLKEGPDGFLYGTTTDGIQGGALFKIKKDGSEFTRVFVFNNVSTTGTLPGSDILFGSDGRLYGMTAGGGVHNQGTIFGVNSDGTNFVRIHSFEDTDAESSPLGTYPFGKLTEGQDGFLYGTTTKGGSNSKGTVFKINKNGTSFQLLVDLDSRASLPYFGPLFESTPGIFFGMTSTGGSGDGGAIFKITSEGDFSIVKDFPQPETTPRNLISDIAGEYYYGITKAKLSTEGGSIFRIKASGSLYEEIFKVPVGDIITTIYYASTDHLWVSGYHDSKSFMFRIKPDGSEREDIAEYNNFFTTPSPAEYMVETSGGEIFGTTKSTTFGIPPVIFKIKNDGTGFLKLSDLPSYATTSLVLGSDGNFYVACGDLGVFKVTSTGMITKIFSHPFPGDSPQVKKMIEMNGGRLCMVTRLNGSAGVTGARNYGTIFSIEKDGSNYRQIYEFKSSESTTPVDMLQSMDGWIYVVSEFGGTPNKGLIYKIRPDGSSYTKVREFNGDDAENPKCILFRRGVQSFMFDPLPEKLTSDPAFSPVIRSTSGAPLQLASTNPTVAIIENGMIKPVGAGSTTIIATLPANANFYAGGRKEQLLLVNKGNQTITFESLPSVYLKAEVLQLNAVSSAGLPIVYESSNPAVASVVGSSVTLHAAGSTVITASQAGNDNFLPAPKISQMLLIKDGSQTISFTGLANKVFGDAPFYLSATASSGLPVAYTTSSDKVHIDGSLVTILKAGMVVIKASQSGNDDFEPATPVQVEFCINPSQPIITESGEYPDIVFHSSNDAGNQWFFNNVAIPEHNSNTISVSEQGTYTVVSTIDGCSSEISLPRVFLTTSVEEQLSDQITVYPNPVVDHMVVEIGGGYDVAVVELLDGMGRRLDVKEVAIPAITEFDMPEHRSGIFLVKITVGGTTVTRKVLLK